MARGPGRDARPEGAADTRRGVPRPTAASGTQQPVQSRAAVGACAPREVPLQPRGRDRRGGAGTWTVEDAGWPLAPAPSPPRVR